MNNFTNTNGIAPFTSPGYCTCSRFTCGHHICPIHGEMWVSCGFMGCPGGTQDQSFWCRQVTGMPGIPGTPGTPPDTYPGKAFGMSLNTAPDTAPGYCTCNRFTCGHHICPIHGEKWVSCGFVGCPGGTHDRSFWCRQVTGMPGIPNTYPDTYPGTPPSR